jgi:hypothetical protein
MGQRLWQDRNRTSGRRNSGCGKGRNRISGWRHSGWGQNRNRHGGGNAAAMRHPSTEQTKERPKTMQMPKDEADHTE